MVWYVWWICCWEKSLCAQSNFFTTGLANDYACKLLQRNNEIWIHMKNCQKKIPIKILLPVTETELISAICSSDNPQRKARSQQHTYSRSAKQVPDFLLPFSKRSLFLSSRLSPCVFVHVSFRVMTLNCDPSPPLLLLLGSVIQFCLEEGTAALLPKRRTALFIDVVCSWESQGLGVWLWGKGSPAPLSMRTAHVFVC